jgi:hypothetical protein
MYQIFDFQWGGVLTFSAFSSSRPILHYMEMGLWMVNPYSADLVFMERGSSGRVAYTKELCDDISVSHFSITFPSSPSFPRWGTWLLTCL